MGNSVPTSRTPKCTCTPFPYTGSSKTPYRLPSRIILINTTLMAYDSVGMSIGAMLTGKLQAAFHFSNWYKHTVKSLTVIVESMTLVCKTDGCISPENYMNKSSKNAWLLLHYLLE